MNKRTLILLWLTLALYLLARICQLFADRIPTLVIVLLHVVPPALFALIHGQRRYGWRGIATFVAFCMGTGGALEWLSLSTSFPFGHYYFTDVMGPKLCGLPFLLVLAYIGIGYASWIVAGILLQSRATLILAQPLLAALLMVCWDLAMDPYWSNIVKAWVWLDGGSYFGVPLSNFAGWFFAAIIYYMLFAFTQRYKPAKPGSDKPQLQLTAILFYGLCAFGNILIMWEPAIPVSTVDATGRVWMNSEIVGNSLLISVLIMGSLTLLALLQWAANLKRSI